MSALYFREPTEEEKQEAGIKEPFTVLDHIEDEPEEPRTDPKEVQAAWDDMFKESKYYLDKIMKGQFLS